MAFPNFYQYSVYVWSITVMMLRMVLMKISMLLLMMMMIKIALTNLEQTSKCLGRNNAEWEAVARTVVAIVLFIASLVIVNIFVVVIVTLRK